MIASWGSYTFLFYACLDIIMSIFVYLFFKETKGRTLEEMEQIFHSRAAFDNEAVRRKALENGSEEGIMGVEITGKGDHDGRSR